MAFTNVQVAPEQLPTFENVTFHDLHPSYARMLCGLTVCVELVLLLVALGVTLQLQILSELWSQYALVMMTVLVIFILWPIYRFKATRAIGYVVRDHDLILRSGLFWQREVVQPIRRIQHVELTRGPLEKRLGLANIRLFSAGTGKATFTIPGLSLVTAVRIRRYVLQATRS